MKHQGCLAVWTDVTADHLEDYRRWLTREHMQQRVVLPGFFGVRLFSAPGDERSHFIFYSTASAQAFQGEAYMAVLNDPTPWTRRTMPRLQYFDRGAGSQRIKAGDGTGAWLLVARIQSPPRADDAAVRKAFAEITAMHDVPTARLYDIDRGATDAPTTEKKMRQAGEGAFQALLMIEAMNEGALNEVRRKLPALAAALGAPDIERDAQVFRAIFSLHPFELQTPADAR